MSRLACVMMLFVLSLSTATLSASTEFFIEQLTTADGLANNTVRYIMRDSRGRMWFATSNGVSVYQDGKFTNLYPAHDKGIVGLSDLRTLITLEDKRGYVWIGTASGVDCFSMKESRLVDYKQSGVVPPVLPKPNNTRAIDSHGTVWRVTKEDGLYVTHKDGSSEHLTTASKNSPLPTNNLKCVYIDADGIIWIGTDNLGVSKLSVTRNAGAEYRDEGENVRMLTTLSGRDIAVANRHGDLWRYDSLLRHEQTLTHYANNTYCMLVDKHGVTWRGTKGSGLYCGDKHVEGLPHHDIYSLLEESDTCLWIATFGGGLVAYNPQKHRVEATLLTQTPESKHVRKLAMDHGHHLWVATSDGVFIINRKQGQPVSAPEIRHLSVKGGQLRHNEVRTLFVDSKNRVYMAELGSGYAMWENGKMTHFTKADSLVNDMVQCFVEDRQGFIWVSTEFGVSRFNPATKKITNYFFSKNMLNNVFAENSGVLLADGTVAFGSANGILIITPSVYNKGEKTTDISATDVAVNGYSAKKNIIYIVKTWWKSPWAIAILLLLLLAAVATYYYNRTKAIRFRERISKLKERADLLSTDIQRKSAEEQDANDKAFAEKVKRIVEEKMSDSDFNVDAFAAQMGMGRTAFFRKMKQATGCSPKEYINKKRVHHAAYLITTTSKTISEIAMTVGFNDPLYFSRAFKGEYKCSPKEWRKLNEE